VKLPRKISRDVSRRSGRANLGDARLARRLEKLVGGHAREPTASFPAALGSSAELEGAYRFMGNSRVSLDALLQPHVDEAVARAEDSKCVLAIHDTTTCKFAHGDPEAIGYLNTGKAGFLVHYTLLASFGQLPRPLGVAHVEALFRARPPRRAKKGGRSKAPGSETTRKKQRESLRWERGIGRTQALLKHPSLIHVADREIDSYSVLSSCTKNRVRFVFRVRVPGRRVVRDQGTISLQDAISAAAPVTTREIVLSRRKSNAVLTPAHKSRRGRRATIQMSAMRLSLDRPRHFGSEFPEALPINVVWVNEVNPPPGEQPIDWLLFTSEPIETTAQIVRIVDIYRARWLIEECNKALKTGCLYEHRQFESRHALLTLLGVSLPVACAILALRTDARRSPTSPATTSLTPLQIRVLRHFSPRKLGPNPSLKQATLAIAAIGGHQRNNGPPGWLVIQRGLTKLQAYVEGWRARSRAKKM
jgi:hypothetical protein